MEEHIFEIYLDKLWEKPKYFNEVVDATVTNIYEDVHIPSDDRWYLFVQVQRDVYTTSFAFADIEEKWHYYGYVSKDVVKNIKRRDIVKCRFIERPQEWEDVKYYCFRTKSFMNKTEK